MYASNNHNGRDGVLKDQLFLIVRFENKRVLVETLNAACEFHSTQEIDCYYALFFARIVKKAVLNILRRFVHRAESLTRKIRSIAGRVVTALYQ